MGLFNSNRIDLVVYHGKCGGALNGDFFTGEAVFFAPTSNGAATYAEHICLNGDVDYGYSLENDEASNENAFLGANPVVYPVRLVLENPAILNGEFIWKIAAAIGIAEDKRERFVADFEDSNTAEREAVFAWLKARDYDGAVIENDLMPVCAGGDWEFQTVYVSFQPEAQVTFILTTPATCQDKQLRRPRMRA
jgi:hypothetical protein